MNSEVLPDPGTAFGQKVRHRLTDEIVVWLTIVDASGIPQPNPVWFLWEGGESVLVYSQPAAARLRHARLRPAVSLNFNNGNGHRDLVVLTGVLGASDAGPALDNPSFMAKYGSHMDSIGMDRGWYSRTFTQPSRIRLCATRGL
jgi:PPOX class probable F420-dependent enzyme